MNGPFSALHFPNPVLLSEAASNGLILHHIGCLVDDLEASIQSYASLFSAATPIVEIQDQKIRLAFVPIGGGVYLELIEPTGASSVGWNMRKHGSNFYHLGFVTSNINQQVDRLEKSGYRIVSSFIGVGFEGRRCVFFLSPQEELIEIIGAESESISS